MQATPTIGQRDVPAGYHVSCERDGGEQHDSGEYAELAGECGEDLI